MLWLKDDVVRFSTPIDEEAESQLFPAGVGDCEVGVIVCSQLEQINIVFALVKRNNLLVTFDNGANKLYLFYRVVLVRLQLLRNVTEREQIKKKEIRECEQNNTQKLSMNNLFLMNTTTPNTTSLR